MGNDSGSKLTYFIAGLGIGVVFGLLFAPTSGEEARDYLTQRAEDGREYAQRKAQELRDRAGDLVERGKQVAKQSTESVSAAIDAGVDAYKREKSKTV
jgi:gas vesicle protein